MRGGGPTEDRRTSPPPPPWSLPECSTASAPSATPRPSAPASAATSSARPTPARTRRRQAWNLAADQRPALVAFPESADDVVAIVELRPPHGLRVVPQGTGHNATPLGSLEDMVLLQHRRGCAASIIDADGRRARVAAGTLWLEVTAPASEHGLAPLAGSSPDVGVVGYSLGGGVGWLGRKHGLAANSVLAIELVTADGRLRRVDADHDPDLFWALRGGGGSFGVVTAMEIALYPLPELYAGAMFWPWERSAEVMHAWREWTRTAPDEVTSSARIMQMPPIPEVPEFAARPQVRDDRRRDHRRPRVRRRGRAGAARPRAGDRHVRHGRAGRAVAAAQRPGGADAGADRAPPARPTCRPRRSTRSWPPPARARARRCCSPRSATSAARSASQPGHGALAKLDAGYLLFGGGLARDAGAGRGAAARRCRRFKAAMAPWDAGTRLPQLRGDRRRLALVLRRGHPPPAGAHQGAGRPGATCSAPTTRSPASRPERRAAAPSVALAQPVGRASRRRRRPCRRRSSTPARPP